MRPYWHVDLKWLFGLACLAAVIVAGVLYSATKLTEEEPATGIFTGVMTTFAKEGDGEVGFEELQALAAANPDEEFTIEGVTLPVQGRELAGLTYDEAVELVVGRIAQTLYADGPDAVEHYFSDGAEGAAPQGSSDQGDSSGLGPFGFLTQDTHDALSRIFTFALLAVPITGVPVALFSRRFGRLGSPGVVLAVGTAPFALAWFVAEKATAETAGGEGLDGALSDALGSAAVDVSSDFLTVLVLGLAMVATAVAGHIGFALWGRFRPEPVEGPARSDEEQPEGADEAPLRDADFPSIGPGGVSQA